MRPEHQTLENLQIACNGLMELAYKLRKRRRPNRPKPEYSPTLYQMLYQLEVAAKSGVERQRERQAHQEWVRSMKGIAKH